MVALARFFATAFFATAFFAVVFLATVVFLAVVFFAGAFFVATFLAVFFAAVFLAVVFLAVVFFAAVFFAAARFGLGDVSSPSPEPVSVFGATAAIVGAGEVSEGAGTSLCSGGVPSVAVFATLRFSAPLFVSATCRDGWMSESPRSGAASCRVWSVEPAPFLAVS